MPANVEKMLWVLMGAGLYALAAWPPMAPVRDGLVALAGACPAAALMRSVDDRRAVKSRMSAPPAQ